MTDKVGIADVKAMKRAKKYGYWTGTYKLDKIHDDFSQLRWWQRVKNWFAYKAEYMFENDHHDPLTFHHPDGYQIRPDRRFKTDMGSVPLFLQSKVPILFAKDRWLREYIMHDSAYAHGGLWISKAIHQRFAFQEITRQYADELLALTIKAAGGSKASSGPIWAGVRLGGWASWNKGDLRNKEKGE